MYDIEGNIVNDFLYTKSCDKHYCEVLIDNTYYGPDGSITDKNNYETYCLRHSCEKLNGVYFDRNGNIVNEVSFNNSCSNLNNPQTGKTLPIILVLSLFISGIITIIYVKKLNIFKKIS